MSPEQQGSGPDVLARRLRRAAVCVGLGLLVEAVALSSNTPIAFLAFVGGGGGLVALGMGAYLHAAVNR